MTAFTKENLIVAGDYIYYHPHADNFWEGRTFIARIKRVCPVTKAKFIKTLIKHYSVEDYLKRLGGPTNVYGEAPLQILMNDGILRRDMHTRKFVLDGKDLK